MTLAYVYIRWSSKKQEKGDSKERQLEACLSYVAQKGWELAGEPIGDFGVSAWKGNHLKSGNLGIFAERVRAGEVPPGSVLVVEALDRLSRQEPRVTQRWLEDLTDLGLRIATVSGDRVYDRASLMSSLGIMETFEILMKAKMANDHPEHLSTMLKASWVTRRREAAGKVIVSAHAPGWLETIGERGDPNRHFKIIPERAAIVQDIYRMAAEGMGARAIATALNSQGAKPFGKKHHHENSDVPGWEHTYVGDLLRSAAVEGDYQPGMGRKSYKNPTGERIVGYFPRVVDADLVARARAAVASRKGKGGRGKGQEELRNLFAGLLVCGECNGRMRMIGNSAKPGRYLVCQTAHSGRGCDQKRTFSYWPFETAALNKMLHLALDDRFFHRPDTSNKIAIELAETNKAIDAKTGAARNLGQAIAAKPELSETLSTLLVEAQNDLRTLKAQAHELQEALNKARGAVSPQEHARRVLEVRGALHHPDHETRLTARRKVIEAIKGVVDYVSCGFHTSDRERTILMVMIGGAHSIIFDNAGNTRKEMIPSPDATADLITQHWGTPEDEARVAAYFRRRAN